MDNNECRNLEIKETYSKDIECLGVLMDLQKSIQEKTYGDDFNKIRETLGSLKEFADLNYHAIQDEFREFYAALGGVDSHGSAIWKRWKSKHKEALDKPFGDLTGGEVLELQYELVDIQHFLFNIMIACGMNGKMLYEMYCAKNKENIERQNREGGY